jgi:hypothetical protein
MRVFTVGGGRPELALRSQELSICDLRTLKWARSRVRFCVRATPGDNPVFGTEENKKMGHSRNDRWNRVGSSAGEKVARMEGRQRNRRSAHRQKHAVLNGAPAQFDWPMSVPIEAHGFVEEQEPRLDSGAELESKTPPPSVHRGDILSLLRRLLPTSWR